jgi:hypothetical protein
MHSNFCMVFKKRTLGARERGIQAAGNDQWSRLPRARPPGAIFRIDELSAETLTELRGVRALGEAEDIEVGAVA